MKVHKELFERWRKYIHLYLAEKNMRISDIKSIGAAWRLARELSIPAEAYKHRGINDNHIETALCKILTSVKRK